MAPRQRRTPTEAWQQLELLWSWPEQRSYEVIRPVVLFGESAESRCPGYHLVLQPHLVK